MNTLTAFLLKTIVISLSGVMAPGAVTAAAIAHGTQKRWSGTQMAIGHGIVEIPLIFLLMLGLHLVFENPHVKTAIGIIGGAFLLWMAYGMLKDIRHPDFKPASMITAGPVKTGIILSATNPYFLFWWATVGLNLALDAKDLGIFTLALFALVHWSCDLVWLTTLTLSAYHGTNLLSVKNQKWILGICALALGGFGIHFLFDAVIS